MVKYLIKQQIVKGKEGKNSLEPFSKELKVALLYSIKTVVSPLKDVRANCFCASLLHTTARANIHATSCIERARQVLK